MPYSVERRPVKSGKNWAIIKKEGGKKTVVGRSTSKAKAKASVRARYANE